ncbi:energy transducer TonB [Sphingomonas sp. ID0503]|uniref:energy transducer TonB n=1 Tax=Sphingomonas sp. ID0503 TaxID=3399691 RepID=UPI003AFA439E
MFNFDVIDFQRVAASTVGALVVSTACLAAAVAPARAAELKPVSVAEWQANVSHKIDGTVRSFNVDPEKKGVATLRLSFDKSGELADAKLATSTGNRELDRVALRTARAIAYPALPATAQGKPVLMKVFFGSEPSVVEKASRDAAAQALAMDANANMNIRPGA